MWLKVSLLLVKGNRRYVTHSLLLQPLPHEVVILGSDASAVLDLEDLKKRAPKDARTDRSMHRSIDATVAAQGVMHRQEEGEGLNIVTNGVFVDRVPTKGVNQADERNRGGFHRRTDR